MTTPDHDELDRIIERYQAKMPGRMARFVTWIRKPELRITRIISGVLLVLLGFVGFLPILGFWMLPLGFLILSNELAIVRRWRRQLSVWWARKRRPAS